MSPQETSSVRLAISRIASRCIPFKYGRLGYNIGAVQKGKDGANL